jgi:hypothetical protein
MAQQNWGEILKYTAVLAAGFVAVKVALKLKDTLDSGVKSAKELAAAAADAAKKTVTEDLNPASDKNLAYRAANAVTGDWISDFFYRNNGDPLTNEEQAKAASDAAAMATSQEAFRQSEYGTSAVDPQSDFRLSELTFANQQGTMESVDGLAPYVRQSVKL